MGATPRWSLCRAPTFIAFAIFASIPFVVVLSFSMENHSFVQLQRRHENLLARQLNVTSGDLPLLDSMTGSQASTVSSTSALSSATTESSSQAVFKPAVITPSDSHTTSQLQSIKNTSSSTPFPQPPSTTSFPVAVLTTDSSTSPTSPTATPGFNTAAFSTITTGILLTSAVTYGIDPSTSPSQTAIMATANSGFWQNKAAVAGTFVVLALIILGAAAGLTFSYYKKRNARRHTRLHDQLFDKFIESGGTRKISPGLSAIPIDPFATPKIHYDPTRVQEKPRELSFYVSPTSLDPGESTKVVPHILRSDIGRESYPISIDSFYGALPSSPSGTH